MLEPVFADEEARFPNADWPSRLRFIAPLFNEMNARAEGLLSPTHESS